MVYVFSLFCYYMHLFWKRVTHNLKKNVEIAGADPENFSRGGPTLTYNCGSAQI